MVNGVNDVAFHNLRQWIGPRSTGRIVKFVNNVVVRSVTNTALTSGRIKLAVQCTPGLPRCSCVMVPGLSVRVLAAGLQAHNAPVQEPLPTCAVKRRHPCSSAAQMMFTSTHTQNYMRTNTHIHAYTHTHIHTCTHTCVHTHTYIYYM